MHTITVTENMSSDYVFVSGSLNLLFLVNKKDDEFELDLLLQKKKLQTVDLHGELKGMQQCLCFYFWFVSNHAPEAVAGIKFFGKELCVII